MSDDVPYCRTRLQVADDGALFRSQVRRAWLLVDAEFDSTLVKGYYATRIPFASLCFCRIGHPPVVV